MRYGIIAVDIRDGSKTWCLKRQYVRGGRVSIKGSPHLIIIKHGPLAFDYASEAEYYARKLNEIIASPDIWYQAGLLPESMKEVVFDVHISGQPAG